MIETVKQYNPSVLKECRLQISLPPEKVQKEVPKILDIEAGKRFPTFRQLEVLSKLYNVPRWVFIRDKLPEQYKYENTVPGFRQLTDSPIAEDIETNSQVKRIMAKLESLRSFILDLDFELDHNIGDFNPPLISKKNDEKIAIEIREWLGCNHDECFSLAEWKERVENKGVFVFLTSKYKGWSHVDRSVFRGLSIFHNKLPVVVINDSDAKKAQTFTLFHEMAHLLRKESTADRWGIDTDVEQWCDRIAGAVLMPRELMDDSFNDLDSLKNLSSRLKVSPYAYLVRQRQLKIINFNFFKELQIELKEEWESIRKKQKEKPGGPARNRPKEILHQYGMFSKIILQAYSDKVINLHNVMRALNLKTAGYVSDLMKAVR